LGNTPIVMSHTCSPITIDLNLQIHVPLDSAIPDRSATSYTTHDHDGEASHLLPMAHLTATTVLGGTVPERNTVGQVIATQIASAISTKSPQETRLVVVGLGLEKMDIGRDEYADLVGLALDII
jgi:proteasome assembly chaperone 3